MLFWCRVNFLRPYGNSISNCLDGGSWTKTKLLLDITAVVTSEAPATVIVNYSSKLYLTVPIKFWQSSPEKERLLISSIWDALLAKLFLESCGNTLYQIRAFVKLQMTTACDENEVQM